MPSGLRRFHQSRQSHFLTFSCYRREPRFCSAAMYDLFVRTLEDTRVRFSLRVYGYVVMPEHVHLLWSEPDRSTLADAMHFLKLSFSKRVRRVMAPLVRARSRCAKLGNGDPFWQKRYYDRNVRDAEEFRRHLRYIHRNPVKRGLVSDPADWPWSSFRHYALRQTGVVEIESEWTARDREAKALAASPPAFLNPRNREAG